MKAIVHTEYGPPDELKLREVDKPVPKANEVLIKLYATTVTSSDCNVRNFTFVPKSFLFLSRLMLGFSKPKISILGIDFAGTIEAAGKDVSKFRKGDQVFGSAGTKMGAHAEYLCVSENGALVLKPELLTWVEAAAIPLAGNTALYFIREIAKMKPGQKILIHGASGAIGTYAVQLARYYGASVTGVCSTANTSLVKSLGADKVIDYTKEDFTESDERYDFVFSAVGKTSFTRCKKILRENGVFLGNNLEIIDFMRIIITSIVPGKRIKGGMSVEKAGDIEFLAGLAGSGQLKPVIDRIFRLEEIAEAFNYVERGHKRGNVVITIS